jgi:hypothetical protein
VVGIALRREQALSDLEYDFLLQLLYFFQPDLEHDAARREATTFVRYLHAHFYDPTQAKP